MYFKGYAVYWFRQLQGFNYTRRKPRYVVDKSLPQC